MPSCERRRFAVCSSAVRSGGLPGLRAGSSACVPAARLSAPSVWLSTAARDLIRSPRALLERPQRDVDRSGLGSRCTVRKPAPRPVWRVAPAHVPSPSRAPMAGRRRPYPGSARVVRRAGKPALRAALHVLSRFARARAPIVSGASPTLLRAAFSELLRERPSTRVRSFDPFPVAAGRARARAAVSARAPSGAVLLVSRSVNFRCALRAGPGA